MDSPRFPPKQKVFNERPLNKLCQKNLDASIHCSKPLETVSVVVYVQGCNNSGLLVARAANRIAFHLREGSESQEIVEPISYEGILTDLLKDIPTSPLELFGCILMIYNSGTEVLQLMLTNNTVARLVKNDDNLSLCMRNRQLGSIFDSYMVKKPFSNCAGMYFGHWHSSVDDSFSHNWLKSMNPTKEMGKLLALTSTEPVFSVYFMSFNAKRPLLESTKNSIASNPRLPRSFSFPIPAQSPGLPSQSKSLPTPKLAMVTLLPRSISFPWSKQQAVKANMTMDIEEPIDLLKQFREPRVKRVVSSLINIIIGKAIGEVEGLFRMSPVQAVLVEMRRDFNQEHWEDSLLRIDSKGYAAAAFLNSALSNSKLLANYTDQFEQLNQHDLVDVQVAQMMNVLMSTDAADDQMAVDKKALSLGYLYLVAELSKAGKASSGKNTYNTESLTVCMNSGLFGEIKTVNDVKTRTIIIEGFLRWAAVEDNYQSMRERLAALDFVVHEAKPQKPT